MQFKDFVQQELSDCMTVDCSSYSKTVSCYVQSKHYTGLYLEFKVVFLLNIQWVIKTQENSAVKLKSLFIAATPSTSVSQKQYQCKSLKVTTAMTFCRHLRISAQDGLKFELGMKNTLVFSMCQCYLISLK